MSKRVAWVIVVTFTILFWSVIYIELGLEGVIAMVGGALIAIAVLACAFAVGTLISGE